MQKDEALNKLLVEAIEKLELAIKKTLEIKDGREKYNIGKLGHSIGLLTQFQEQIFIQNPQLRPDPPSDRIPDPEMTEGQLKIVSTLTAKQINEIDDFLIARVTTRWQKVAKVVATTMNDLPFRVKGLPDIFYARRVEKLVEHGVFESQGNLKMMRYSEVRLKEKNNNIKR